MGSDRHRETEKLIAVLLQPEDREQLEQTIREFTLLAPQGDKDVDFVADVWNTTVNINCLS